MKYSCINVPKQHSNKLNSGALHQLPRLRESGSWLHAPYLLDLLLKILQCHETLMTQPPTGCTLSVSLSTACKADACIQGSGHTLMSCSIRKLLTPCDMASRRSATGLAVAWGARTATTCSSFDKRKSFTACTSRAAACYQSINLKPVKEGIKQHSQHSLYRPDDVTIFQK